MVVDDLVCGTRQLVEHQAGQHEAQADGERRPGTRGGRRRRGHHRDRAAGPRLYSGPPQRSFQGGRTNNPCQAPQRARARGPASRPGFACGTPSFRSASSLRSVSPSDSSSHTSSCPAPGSASTSAASRGGRRSWPGTAPGASTTARSSSTTRRAISTCCGALGLVSQVTGAPGRRPPQAARHRRGPGPRPRRLRPGRRSGREPRPRAHGRRRRAPSPRRPGSTAPSGPRSIPWARWSFSSRSGSCGAAGRSGPRS